LSACGEIDNDFQYRGFKVAFMYVCICNAVTDRQIQSHCECRGDTTVAALYRTLGVKLQCGKCVPSVKTILDSSSRRPNAKAA
jgi:bacterioferritin-associated ferredoxin